MADDCAPVTTPADAVGVIQDTLGSAVSLCGNLTGQILSVVQAAIEKAAATCSACTAPQAEAVTGPIEQGDRVADRMDSVLFGEFEASLMRAQRLIAKLDAEQGGEPPETATAAPQEPSEADQPPVAAETNGEQIEPTEPPVAPEPPPLPEPTTPRIIIASAADTGLITQCRVDLYTAPEVLRGFLQAIAARARDIGMTGADGRIRIVELLDESGLAKVPFVGEALKNFVGNFDTVLNNAINTAVNIAGCASGNTLIAPVEAIFQFFAQYVSPNIAELALPLTYARRANCPTEFPSSAQAISAYLSNDINETILRSWLAINNDCWEPMQPVVHAQRAKLTAGEILSLLLREKLTDKQFVTRLRELGFVEHDDYKHIRSLGEWLLPPSDLIRLMVRDVWRTSVVERFGMDDVFDEAFPGDAERHAGYSGVTRERMQLLWRAHWGIPAPGQLAQMNHRLPYVDDAFIAESNRLLRSIGSEVTVSRKDFSRDVVRDDVFKALVQQDVLPFWIPRLLALTYRPLTRRELRFAANAAVIDRGRLVDAYRELGVTQANAELLAKMAAKRRNQRAAGLEPVRLYKQGVISRTEAAARLPDYGVTAARIKQVLDDASKAQSNHEAVKAYRRGAITRGEAAGRLELHGITKWYYADWLNDIDAERTTHPIVKRYAAGLIDRDAAEREMGADGISAPAVKRLLDEADDKLDSSLMKFCAGAIEKRFLLGELTEGQVHTELSGLGMSGRLMDWWARRMKCKRASLGKTATAARLFRWLDIGLIGADEFVQRLVKMGYKQGEAILMLREASQSIDAKRARERERLARKSAAEVSRQQREAKARAKQTDRQLNKLAKATAAAAKARERREKRLVEAADKLRDALGVALADALAQARAAVKAGREDYGLGPDERLDVLETAIRRWSADDGMTFMARYREVAAARELAERIA